MGRLIVSMNTSLDSYITAEGEDDGSWLRIDEEVHTVFNEFASGADAFLYGRKAYEVMIPYWPDTVDDVTKAEYEREYARLWNAKLKLVVSSTLKEAAMNTQVLSTEPFDEIRRLKQETSGYILCYGGAELVSALHQRQLIDEYILFVHPSTLGAGTPLFRQRVDLCLKEIRRFAQGVTEMRYLINYHED